MPAHRWTITALTIPGRESYLEQLIHSIDEMSVPGGARIVIVYNRPIRDDLEKVERTFQSWSDTADVDVYFNNGDPTISGGRNFQLNLAKSPLIAFVDDDVTVHGEAFEEIEDTLRRLPAGLVGLPSYVGKTDQLFKPRDTTPHVATPELRYMTVQGMLVAGYTNLLRDIGGFNPRRRFWGEWTELNLRTWRNGFPTGYIMRDAFLRHWEDAPDSPTRSLEGRARHVLWGLICTALEYDAVDVTHATEAFWRLVEERYLAYSFGEGLSPKAVLQATLELMPELSAAWGDLSAFRAQVREHPFDFKPFHPLTDKDVQKVLPHAKKRIAEYRDVVWPSRSFRKSSGTLLRKLRALWAR